MVLQREKPIAIFGTSDQDETVSVHLNEELIHQEQVLKGSFSILIPEQPAQVNVTLKVNDIELKNVDIGEIWLAGGQSNMEFWMRYEQHLEEEITNTDPHLRMYTVGQYSFEGERELGFKQWNQWDRWVTAEPSTIPEMCAIGYYFAKKMREKGIPVGIVSSNWGGTSAVSWTPKAALSKNPQLKFYMDNFNEIVSNLDLERYYSIKEAVRPLLSSQESYEGFSHVIKNTYSPSVLEKIQADEASQPKPANWIEINGEKINISELTYEEMTEVGPQDVKEPGCLFEQMIAPIAGFSIKGVLWYQGESDCDLAEHYHNLFKQMVQSWREAWLERNKKQTYLPFYVVQIAPFGEWLGNEGSKFVKIREQQELIADSVPDNYLISSSDVGNIFDIHPKNKKVLAERLYQLVDHIDFGNPAPAYAPRAKKLNVEDGKAIVIIENCQQLVKEERDFESYNGFELAEIPDTFIPPITDGINGLEIIVDGITDKEVKVNLSGNQMIIESPAIAPLRDIKINFAKTAFYEVNIYNELHHPLMPFALSN